jgi:hypothetical protein
MKIKHALFLFTIIFQATISSGFAQSGKPSIPTDKQFTALWKSVDSLTELGQPRSALEIVTQVYSKAKEQKNSPQFLKAILYRVRLNSDFQEDFLNQTIRDLRAELKGTEEPVTSVLHSILGEIYLKYYENNLYRFKDRTRLAANLPDSISTWDLNTIAEAVTNEYLLSVANVKLLSSIPIQTFEAILEIPDKENLKKEKIETVVAIRPTLYDFLAHRALDYFSSGRGPANLSTVAFRIDNAAFFSPTAIFIHYLSGPVGLPVHYYSYDSISGDWFAFRLFQSLAALHQEDKNPAALIDVELKRLAFVRQEYVPEGADSLYIEAMKRMLQNHAASPHSADISYAYANFCYDRSVQYRPLESERYKWDARIAAEACEEAMHRFPESNGAINCRTLAKIIRQPAMNITTEYAVPAEKPALALLGYKNVNTLYFRIVKIDPDDFAARSANNQKNDFFKYLTGISQAASWSVSLPEDGDLQNHKTEIRIPAVPEGFYILLGSADKNFSDHNKVFGFAPFWSTGISYISRREPDGSIRYQLFERTAGTALKNVKAEYWVKSYDYTTRKYVTRKLNDFISDETGGFVIPPVEAGSRQANSFLKFFSQNDKLITENFYQYPVSKTPPRTTVQTMFYTDRAIYRPGQILYFKGIVIEKTGNENRIRTDFNTTVVFTDVNGQKVAEQSFTTNEFGSFNGSFTMPVGVLAGQMSLSNESGSTSISLEEYKRPTFEVLVDPLEGNYMLGKQITVTGKAQGFSGTAIDGATVNYRVVRTARFPFRDRGWYWPDPSSPQTEIASGIVNTGSAGQFTFNFPAIADPGIPQSAKPVFNYSLTLDVTDGNGEMQSSSTTVSVGYTSLLLDVNLPDQVNLRTDSIFRISATNLNGRSTPADITLTIIKLKQPDRVFKPRMWDRPDLLTLTREQFYSEFPHDIYGNENDPATWPAMAAMTEKTFNTKTDSLLDIRIHKLDGSGTYLVRLSATDPHGQQVELKRFITAFDPGAKEMPVNAIAWFMPLVTSGQPGGSASLLAGSKEDNVTLMAEVLVRDSLVSRQWYSLNDRILRIDQPIIGLFRGNFTLNVVFVKHNRVFQHSMLVSVPYENKKLDVEVGSFRSKLTPGQKEEWKIRITAPGNKIIPVEFLAALYDISLDAFRQNNWSFPIYPVYSGSSPWNVDDGFKISSGNWFAAGHPNLEFRSPVYYQLNWFGLNYFGGFGNYGRFAGNVNADRMMEKTVAPLSMDSPQPESVEIKSETTAEPDIDHGKMTSGNPVPVKTRRDFRETAFFYPSLVTDSTGNILLQFTAPESLTGWRFLGLAHSKNLDYSLIEKELVTKKELMIFPNAPRFLRKGDTTILSTRIVNLSGSDLTAEARIELFDAITMKSLDSLVTGAQQLQTTVNAGSNSSVSWQIVLPSDPSLSVLQYRITARAGNFSDGEEKAIPVLPNRMMVTETLPLPIRGKGSVDFNFEKLLQSAHDNKGSLKNYRLTLEFASNPAWYAIQALPGLNDKTYENADEIFGAFYSNSLAAFIALSNPKIKAVFESWKNLTPDALLSGLEKNQELKTAILQETPWVAEASDESSRKQMLGQYFDLDNLQQNLQSNLRKLQRLQTSSGGWTWFEGMPESRYITQNIITGLGHLDNLGISGIKSDPVTRDMIARAIQYLDSELRKDFDKVKKNKHLNPEMNHLGSVQIQYLYARSYFMSDSKNSAFALQLPAREAFTYFREQAEKYWLRQDRHLQGMIALALSRLGNKEIPSLIMKSLSEKALHSPESGMYWASEPGYSWYQAPVETQAMMIEAFDEVARDEQTVEELRIWLLKQKQTQHWRSSHATVEAIYALLLRGTDLLSEDPEVKITLGKEKVDSRKLDDTKTEAGTGYFKVSWQGSEISPDMGRIRVSKSTNGVAWGGLYWQYFENLDKITPAKTPMRLEKQLFVETITPTGPVLVAPGESNTLSVGDKIKVRIVLTIDRDLEFVHMKDMRAAAFEPYLAVREAPAPGMRSFASGAEGLSGYRHQDGLGYYQSATDAAMNFFFDYLPKGTYVFEYMLKANAAGEYSNGITTVQCMYAPEFSAHSEGVRVRVK